MFTKINEVIKNNLYAELDELLRKEVIVLLWKSDLSSVLRFQVRWFA